MHDLVGKKLMKLNNVFFHLKISEVFSFSNQEIPFLGGGFKYLSFSPLGEDSHCSNGLKPPTRCVFSGEPC